MSKVNLQYQKLISNERRKLFIEAFILNAFLIFYSLFSGYYLFEIFSVDYVDQANLQTEFVVGFLGMGFVLGFFWAMSGRSPGRILLERTNRVLKGFYVPSHRPFYQTTAGIFVLFVSIETILLGFFVTEISFYSLFSYQGIMGAQRIFAAIFEPEMGILGIVLEAMVETIFIAMMATALAIPVAFVTSFLSARNLMKGSRLSISVYNFFRFIFNFTRSVEPLIWAIIFSVWVGIGPFAGMLALMLHSVASLAKLYSEQIENVNQGPIEAIETTGAGRIQVIWFAVVPQIVLPFLSFTIYRWDINIRMATIIGLVGGGGVGTLLMQYQGLAKWNEVGTIVIVIAVVVWVMDYLSARIREAIY